MEVILVIVGALFASLMFRNEEKKPTFPAEVKFYQDQDVKLSQADKK